MSATELGSTARSFITGPSSLRRGALSHSSRGTTATVTFTRCQVKCHRPSTLDERHIARCSLFPSPSVPDGTAVEWYAEKDQYVVISNCPYADQALPFPEAQPNPVYVSVWDTGIKPYSENHPGTGDWTKQVYGRIATKDTSPR